MNASVLYTLLTKGRESSITVSDLTQFGKAFQESFIDNNNHDQSNPNPNPTVIALLSTNLGRAHVRALSSLLQVNESRAATVTVEFMESHVRKGGFFSEDNVDSDFSSISPTSSPIGTLPFLRLCIHSHYDSEIYNLKILHDLLLSDLSDNHSSLHTIIKPFLDEWLSSVDIVGLCLERLVSGWLKSSFNFSSSSSSSSGSTRDIQKLMEVYQSTKTNPSPNANSSNIYEIQKFNSHTHAQTITQSLHITTNLLSLLTLLLYTRVTPDRSTLLAIVNSLKRVNFFGGERASPFQKLQSNPLFSNFQFHFLLARYQITRLSLPPLPIPIPIPPSWRGL